MAQVRLVQAGELRLFERQILALGRAWGPWRRATLQYVFVEAEEGDDEAEDEQLYFLCVRGEGRPGRNFEVRADSSLERDAESLTFSLDGREFRAQTEELFLKWTRRLRDAIADLNFHAAFQAPLNESSIDHALETAEDLGLPKLNAHYMRAKTLRTAFADLTNMADAIQEKQKKKQQEKPGVATASPRGGQRRKHKHRQRQSTREKENPLRTPELERRCRLKRVVDEEPLLSRHNSAELVLPELEAAERALEAKLAARGRGLFSWYGARAQGKQRFLGMNVRDVVWTVAVVVDVTVLGLLAHSYVTMPTVLEGLPLLA